MEGFPVPSSLEEVEARLWQHRVTSQARGAQGAHTQARVHREVGATDFILCRPYEKFGFFWLFSCI